MFLDTIVGFKARKDTKIDKNGTVIKMFLEFTCNYCNEVLDIIELTGPEIRHADTYTGLEGYLQLHWMGCEPFRKIKVIKNK